MCDLRLRPAASLYLASAFSNITWSQISFQQVLFSKKSSPKKSKKKKKYDAVILEVQISISASFFWHLGHENQRPKGSHLGGSEELLDRGSSKGTITQAHGQNGGQPLEVEPVAQHIAGFWLNLWSIIT